MREAEERKVDVEDVCRETFWNLLFYIYSGCLKEEKMSFGGYLDLLKAADRYLLEVWRE